MENLHEVELAPVELSIKGRTSKRTRAIKPARLEKKKISESDGVAGESSIVALDSKNKEYDGK
jgi:hypothetical protein